MAMRPKWVQSIRRGSPGGGILGGAEMPISEHADDWRHDIEETLHEGEITGREYDSAHPDEREKK